MRPVTLGRRATRMEMAKQMQAEVQIDLDGKRALFDFEVLNLLSGAVLALEQMRGLYAAYDRFQTRSDLRSDASLGTFGVTPLMRPCDGSKRVSVTQGGYGG